MVGNPMLEAAVCPLCGQGWCGRPCLRDPKKSNALLFDRHGAEKTLHERGLAWDDPPLVPAAPAPRRKPPMVLLKKLADTGGTKPGTKPPGTKPPQGTKPHVGGTKPKGGRPAVGEKPMTAAERKRRWLERQKKEKS